MPSTDDPNPTAAAAAVTRARRAHSTGDRRWRAAVPPRHGRALAPDACVPEPPSDVRGRHDGGDAGPTGGFWAVLRAVLAATAGR